ncbi:hypothetical protein [Pseudorhizobium flavum]|uniref:Uncharacterized protein n=1 Tax=Pseudorhizobium flavum TaxID=1335061 RepID=A0A7W9YY99_9HYPH|nr:hypothetical protein [Pseudorhizobium flavum]MBB6179836.1 hypothetical protein [Pseudorhizobium flavum]CAD6597090.1 hypothetical protein RFYW14_00454 [Pseudorhizobium flavum]
MTFDNAMQAAARAADSAVWKTVEKFRGGGVFDEPEISTYLISQLDSEMTGRIGGLSWSSTILRNGKGKAGEEKQVGADILLHVSLETPTDKYSKGVLIQAKKAEPYQPVPKAVLDELNDQCRKMLSHSPSAFVMSYSTTGFRTGSATRFSGTQSRDIHRVCTWTSYRFFLELFRCPVGDPRITSGRVKELPVPNVIHLAAEGRLGPG